MKLTRYTYTGPQSAASLRVGEARELLEVQLLPGKPVELPADHEYTLVLLELKHLVLLPSTEKPAGKTAIASQKTEQE
ncbi:hypothetical protein [Pseudomonas sp. Irchel s3h14]|uniref:hypothetical protein n=1 Tax=Pseudomonas sp. Irchel s3h14 TaxID=2009179 RepID=UPI000BA4043C|nr:hypothetical protein [Pseudomonas sp. Irchel s3h14]